MFTVKQAAKEIGISASLVYGLCTAGKIRHERHGLGRGTIRIPREALDEYRRNSTVSGTDAAEPAVLRLKHLKLTPQ
jgi:excisionase family DNA binding protein